MICFSDRILQLIILKIKKTTKNPINMQIMLLKQTLETKSFLASPYSAQKFNRKPTSFGNLYLLIAF